MIEQIKRLRVEIDGLTQLCEGLKPITNYVGGVDPYRDDIIPFVLAHPSENSQEIKEAVKSLKLSKAWLGKVLERLGRENPYGSGYKTVEDIVPETDKAKTVCGVVGIDKETPRLEAIDTFTLNGKIMNEYSQMSHIEKVDWLRTEIKRLLGKIEKPTVTIDVSSIKGDFNIEKYLEEMNKYGVMLLGPCVQVQSGGIDKAAQYLQEARFWLGFELGKIRDESK